MFNFLSLVAVFMAIFTMAAHGRVFIDADETDCFRPPVTIKQTCKSAPITLTTSTICSMQYVGSHIYGLNFNNPISQGNIEIECPGSQTLCCFTIEEDPIPCIDQPLFNITGSSKYYKISSIYCRNAE